MSKLFSFLKGFLLSIVLLIVPTIVGTIAISSLEKGMGIPPQVLWKFLAFFVVLALAFAAQVYASARLRRNANADASLTYQTMLGIWAIYPAILIGYIIWTMFTG